MHIKRWVNIITILMVLGGITGMVGALPISILPSFTSFFIAWGIHKSMRWAWIAAVILSIFSLVEFCTSLAYVLTNFQSLIVVIPIPGIAVYGLAIFCLCRRNVRLYYGKPKPKEVIRYPVSQENGNNINRIRTNKGQEPELFSDAYRIQKNERQEWDSFYDYPENRPDLSTEYELGKVKFLCCFAIASTFFLVTVILPLIFLHRIFPPQVFLWVIITFLTWYGASDALIRKNKIKIVSDAEYPILHEIVRRLTRRIDIPSPRIGIMDINSPDAFTIGRNEKNSTIVICTGLMNYLNPKELEAVLAHELGHIVNTDYSIMTWVKLGNRFGAGLFSYPLSRYSEFAADEVGVKIVGHTKELIMALMKIDGWPGEKTKASIFDNYPSMQQRIDRIKKIEKEINADRKKRY